MLVLIDRGFPFSSSSRVLKGSSIWKSLSVCQKASVLPDTVRRTASIGTREVQRMSTGSQKRKNLACWTGHTIPFLCLLISMHKIC